MAVVTTGSTLSQGLVPGMSQGLMASGTYSLVKPHLIFVNTDPLAVITSITGSDICYDISTGSFLIGDITNGVGGSTWLALRTV